MDEAVFLSRLQLDRKSGTPLYVQLEAQIKAVIGSTIHPGDRLPTIRAVAVALAIDQNTVLRVYRDLEQEGIVESLRSKGTFIRRPPKQIDKSIQTQRVIDLAQSTITTARTMALDPRKVGEAILVLTEEDKNDRESRRNN